MKTYKQFIEEASIKIHTMTTAHKFLKKAGFNLVSDNGSHTKFEHTKLQGDHRIVMVPKHKGDLSIGVSRKIESAIHAASAIA